MARVVPGGDCRQIEIGGATLHRDKDGAFHVNDKVAKRIAEATGGFVAGTVFRSEGTPEPTGPWCKHGQRPFYCKRCKNQS